MVLTKGRAYDLDRLELVGWTTGDGTGIEGYDVWTYFDDQRRYLGPDQHGIEPLIIVRCTEREAYEWAVREQGFRGDYNEWLALPPDKRREYEDGAAGIPTA